MSQIVIVDYGMGNLGSLQNMFRRIGVDAEIAGDADSILQARKLLLPGVGAFDAAMRRINELALNEPLRRRAIDDRVPMLGICLGMQLLTDGSDEGELPGLGLIRARAHRLVATPERKVPHMGWNVVRQANPSPLTSWMNDEKETRFYFVHSYAVQVEHPEDEMLSCEYGTRFAAGIARQNVFGAQFHPEKSHRFGMRLLSAFAALPC